MDKMNYRIYNFLLLVTSLTAYLQWGDDHHAFLFQMELEIFKEILSNPMVFFNPVVMIPILGQVLIIIAIILKKSNRYLTYTGIVVIGLLFTLIFYAGILSNYYWIPVSTLPFFTISFLTILHYRKL